MDEYTKIKILELIKDYQGAVILVTHEKKIRDMLNVTTYNLIDKKLDLFSC
jgi:ATPase subunit of ABC transporter with duplicated ATPase domains